MKTQLLRLITAMVVCLAVPMLVSGCGPAAAPVKGAKEAAEAAAEKKAAAEAAEKAAREKAAKEAAERVSREKATREAAEVKAKDEAARLAAGQPLGRGHTGRWEPRNLREKLAMDQVIENPAAGTLVPLKLTNPPKLGDTLWPEDGWVKLQQIVEGTGDRTVIHYLFNPRIGKGAIDDLKFVK